MKLNPQTFIFFGRSGCGKGTQATLLKAYMEKFDTSRKVLYVETGAKFREFVGTSSYSSALTKAIIDKGGLLPAFLPVWLWTSFFIENLTGTEHMVLDGLSRRVPEAPVLDSAMHFYNRESPFVIVIDVSKDWAKARLLARGRSDDNTPDIERRLGWYESDVLPTLEFFKKDPYYRFIEVNGEQPIEKVQAELMSKLRLS